MDKLEHFIVSHKSEFDNHEPPKDLWKKIEEDLPKQPKAKLFNIRTIMSIAAFGAVLFLAGIGVSSLMMDSRQQAMADISPELVKEFEEAEQYYERQVRVKLDGLENTEQKQDVLSDLNQLDQVYSELRDEMLEANGLNNEKVLRSMIDHQRTKLQVLEKVLDKIDKQKKSPDFKINGNENIEI